MIIIIYGVKVSIITSQNSITNFKGKLRIFTIFAYLYT